MRRSPRNSKGPKSNVQSLSPKRATRTRGQPDELPGLSLSELGPARHQPPVVLAAMRSRLGGDFAGAAFGRPRSGGDDGWIGQSSLFQAVALSRQSEEC